jgi:hypothetical protein
MLLTLDLIIPLGKHKGKTVKQVIDVSYRDYCNMKKELISFFPGTVISVTGELRDYGNANCKNGD